MFTIPLDKEALRHRPRFPQEAVEVVDWGIGISTASATRQGCREEMREVEWGVNPFFLLIVLPQKIPAENSWVSALLANRKGILYEQLVKSQPQWTIEAKRQLIEPYAHRIEWRFIYGLHFQEFQGEAKRMDQMLPELP